MEPVTETAPRRRPLSPRAGALITVAVLVVAASVGALWMRGAKNPGATPKSEAPPSTAVAGVPLSITTVPSGVPLFDESRSFLGNSPLELTPAAGRFSVSAQFSDHRITREIELVLGQPTAVEIVAKVALRVTVQKGVKAMVVVDGKNRGEAPLELPAFAEPGQPIKVVLSAIGYARQELEVTATAGIPLVIDQTLKLK
jgi:hypothetical protein